MSFSLISLPEVAALRQLLRQQILELSLHPPDKAGFESLALAVFRYQAAYNPVYNRYLHYLNIQPEQVSDLRRVPFMPIGFFKNHTVQTAINSLTNNQLTFTSSGTTGQTTSRHVVADPELYDTISRRIFEQTYGPLSDFQILALLPSYLERNNSSLVYMVQRFMAQSSRQTPLFNPKDHTNEAGFYLHNYPELTNRLRQLARQPESPKTLLIGVTFGLLDWVESEADLSFLRELPNFIVMETGGMKGRRRELLREEVHEILTKRLGVPAIHSEYGMTELLSQAYSKGGGVFRQSATLRVFLRDINDPFSLLPNSVTQPDERRTGERRTGERRTGGINMVDLANLDSCSFIETQDLGQFVNDSDYFRVIGRFDNSDVRGCNLMVL